MMACHLLDSGRSPLLGVALVTIECLIRCNGLKLDERIKCKVETCRDLLLYPLLGLALGQRGWG